MTDVRMRLLDQTTTRNSTPSATVTWVPTVPAVVSTGLQLPAPKTVAYAGTDLVITGLAACDGTAGWAWQVMTTVDGAIRDQRTVLVPDPSAVFDFETLVQVQPSDLHNLNADQVWVGLEGSPPSALFRGWWLVSAPGNPALGIETGSGDLRRVL